MTTETKSPQPAVINPRNTGMKWKRLGRDKEPSFDELYLLCNEKEIGQSEYAYSMAKLYSITVQNDGKEYSFITGYDKNEERAITESHFTHYCEIKPPVD